MKAIIITLLKSFLLAKGKLLLCVLASILSTWGIGTILYSKVMTDRDFEQNFSASNPADIIITINNTSSTTIANLSSNNYVKRIERRETITGRIKNKNGSWMSLLIFACSDITQPSVSKFLINKPYRNNSLFIELNGLDFLDTSKNLSIQIPGNDTFNLSFGGRSFDPSLPPSKMEQMVYAYTNIPTFSNILNKSVNQRFLIKLKKKYRSEAEIREISKLLQKLITQNGNSVSSIIIPPPGEHPHQNIVNGIAFLQNSLGFTLSLLGIILLSLMLITWLYPQIVNVGIMKTVGASARMVLAGYLSVLLLILGIGLLIGLPLGYATAKAYSRFIDFLQNFAPVTSPLPLQTHLFAIILTVALPLLTSTIQLVNVSKTSVYQALNKVFYTPYKSIFNLTNRFFKNTKIKYSINNLFRSNQRTGLLLLLLIAGISLFTAGFNLRHSLKTDFKNYISFSTYDITVILNDNLKERLPALNTMPFIEKVEYINNVGIQFKSNKTPYFQNTTISIFSPDYELNNSLFIKGQPKPGQNKYLYVSQKYAEDFSDILLGKPIEVKYENGTCEKLLFGGVIKNITNPGFYRYNNAANGIYNELAIKLKTGFNAEKASQLINEELEKKSIAVRNIINSEVKLAKLENHLKPTYLIIQVMGFITLIIALAGLMIVLNLSMQERAQEIGIIKALGSSVKDIVSMYQSEYLVITIISLVVGFLIGDILNSIICKLFGVMVLEVPVKPLIDIKVLLFTIFVVIVVQTMLITIYIRTIIVKTSASMTRNL